MNGMPYVTVITPTYNLIDKELADDFNILTTLLTKQSYPNIEHIIIDKASKDGTVRLLSDYKSKGYLNFYSEPDMGRFDALSKGVMRAKGKYVIFLNPSDFIHDIMAIEELVVAMEENEAAYSYGTSYGLHPDKYILPFSPAILNVFQVLPCPLQAMMFRKDVLDKENYFDNKLKNFADFDLIMRLVLKEYPGILYDKNYVTYKISNEIVDESEKFENEARAVYIKNFRSFYPLTNEIVDKIAKYSEFPKDLLEKLSKYFPEEYKENFFAACEEMHRIRVEAISGNNTSEIQQETPSLSQNTEQNSEPPATQHSGVQRQTSGISGVSMRQTNPQQPLRHKPPMPGV